MGGEEKILILALIFMKNRNQTLYESVLRKFFDLHKETAKIKELVVRTDMELGQANAWKTICDERNIHISQGVCSFHWVQLIQRLE